MTVVVGVKCGEKIAIATNVETQLGDERAGPPNYAGKEIAKIGSSIIALSGWSVYLRIFHKLAQDPSCPDPVDQESIFEFFVWAWKQARDNFHFVNDQCDSSDSDPFVDLHSSFLVAAPHGLFFVNSQMSVLPYTRYIAMGSGGDYAMGALDVLYDPHGDPAAIAVRAAQAASNLDIRSRGPIEVWTLGGERRVVEE